jgi:hypothetical protein
LAPTGRVTISLPDVLRELATLRATTTKSPRVAVSTLARFGAFFVTEVARAFLTVRRGKAEPPTAR